MVIAETRQWFSRFAFSKVRTQCATSVPAICHNITRSRFCRVRVRAVQLGDEVCGAGHTAHGVICKEWCERKCGQKSSETVQLFFSKRHLLRSKNTRQIRLLLLHPSEDVYTYFTRWYGWLSLYKILCIWSICCDNICFYIVLTHQNKFDLF